MKAHEITLTARPPRLSASCGPGSLEMIDITTWTRRDIGWVRIHGHYDVYCGMGNMHRIAVDEKAWAADYAGRPLDEVADELLALVLDDEWADPCDTADVGCDQWKTTHRSRLDGSEVRMVNSTGSTGLAENENGDRFLVDLDDWEEL